MSHYEYHERTIGGWCTRILFVLFNAGMLAWLLSAWRHGMHNYHSTFNEQERGIEAMSLVLGTLVMLIPWACGALILGLAIYFTRGAKIVSASPPPAYAGSRLLAAGLFALVTYGTLFSNDSPPETYQASSPKDFAPVRQRSPDPPAPPTRTITASLNSDAGLSPRESTPQTPAAAEHAALFSDSLASSTVDLFDRICVREFFDGQSFFAKMMTMKKRELSKADIAKWCYRRGSTSITTRSASGPTKRPSLAAYILVMDQ
jgi:hypothetical protein